MPARRKKCTGPLQESLQGRTSGERAMCCALVHLVHRCKRRLLQLTRSLLLEWLRKPHLVSRGIAEGTISNAIWLIRWLLANRCPCRLNALKGRITIIGHKDQRLDDISLHERAQRHFIGAIASHTS